VVQAVAGSSPVAHLNPCKLGSSQLRARSRFCKRTSLAWTPTSSGCSVEMPANQPLPRSRRLAWRAPGSDPGARRLRHWLRPAGKRRKQVRASLWRRLSRRMLLRWRAVGARIGANSPACWHSSPVPYGAQTSNASKPPKHSSWSTSWPSSATTTSSSRTPAASTARPPGLGGAPLARIGRPEFPIRRLPGRAARG
jgi:hypothetical protein